MKSSPGVDEESTVGLSIVIKTKVNKNAHNKSSSLNMSCRYSLEAVVNVEEITWFGYGQSDCHLKCVFDSMVWYWEYEWGTSDWKIKLFCQARPQRKPGLAVSWSEGLPCREAEAPYICPAVPKTPTANATVVALQEVGSLPAIKGPSTGVKIRTQVFQCPFLFLHLKKTPLKLNWNLSCAWTTYDSCEAHCID